MGRYSPYIWLNEENGEENEENGAETKFYFYQTWRELITAEVLSVVLFLKVSCWIISLKH